MVFPGGSDGKEYACSAGDPGLIPGSGRSPGNLLQKEMITHSSILAWRITWAEEPDCPWGLKDSGTTEQLTHLH